jgi:exo-beta-1,3-glucanase (GH17 family)
MKISFKIFIAVIAFIFFVGCNSKNKVKLELAIKPAMTAATILGNPDYLAISYGGYRDVNHDIEPTIAQLKEDMKILSAMGIGIIRTYKLHLPHASNVVKAILELKKEDPNFEMYVMLGVWINCKNGFTDKAPVHNEENLESNTKEINMAVSLANKYPDIVKVIAIGNEAMVTWQQQYYVTPNIILKWANYLQDLKKSEKLPKDLWVTSSDNFASWGGGEDFYHTEDLNKLIHAVDFISMHSYPMHDTHYNSAFWAVPEDEKDLSDIEKIDLALLRSLEYAKNQYESVSNYMKKVGADKPIHIGETGWATVSNDHYGPNGSKAIDEYKQAKYHDLIRNWTNENKIACFYFSAFDESWKDATNPQGSENNFGLFTIDGKAKYALWDEVDKGTFKGLKRGDNKIAKTFNGDKKAMMKTVMVPNTDYPR